MTRTGRRLNARILQVYTIIMLLFIFFPGIYLTAVSFNPSGDPYLSWGFSLSWYYLLLEQPRMISALTWSIAAALLCVTFALPFVLLAARTYENIRFKNAFFSLVILPIILPAAVIGIGLSTFLRFLGVGSSIWTILIGHLLWVTPFCLIVLLVTLTGFRKSIREAGYTLGATGWQVFKDLEAPVIKGGIISVILVSLLLSFNEYPISFFLTGERPTYPIYLWGAFLAGTDPTIYAMAGLTMVISFIALSILLLPVGRTLRKPGEKPTE